MSDEQGSGIAGKIRSFLTLVIVVSLMTMSYKCGERGPDPRVWFAPPTFTPTPTVTATATPTVTETFTVTATPTMTFTPTATPKPKPRPAARRPVRKPAAKPRPATGAEFDFPASAAPIPKNVGPQLVCTVTMTGAARAEVEPNDVFYEAQELGSLGMSGQISAQGTLSEVGANAGSVTGDSTTRDPRTRDSTLDRDVYTFSVDQPGFRAILDCYSSKQGKPDPAQGDNDYQLEIYDENFSLVTASLEDDPVESVACTAPGKSFFAVVYGFSGKPGKYRLTLIK